MNAVMIAMTPMTTSGMVALDGGGVALR
jgi:hypothetical protein